MDKYYFTSETAKAINPPPESKFLVRQRDAIEELYPSRKTAPLGSTRAPNIPHETLEMTFGVKTPKDTPAGDLIYPSKKRINQSVYSEIYSYKKPIESARSTKIQADHLNNAGDQMKEILNYDRNKYSSVIAPCYGKKVSADCFNMKSNGETVACDLPEQIQKFRIARDKESKMIKDKKDKVSRNHVEVLWNSLKIKNHVNFLDLVSAFKAYQNGSGKITVSDLQQMCEKLGISVPVHTIEKLVEKCDIIDKDGALSYEEFIHCLNWKDMLPENNNFKTSKYANDWEISSYSPPQDIIDLYRTTSSFIGDHRYPVNLRKAGLPSRIDVDKSNLKGVSQFKECGDASSMIQPNSFSKYGVFEEDLKIFYSKDQIKQVLRSSGIIFSNAVFEKVWHNVNCNDNESLGSTFGQPFNWRQIVSTNMYHVLNFK